MSQLRLTITLLSVDERSEVTSERVEDRLAVHIFLPVLTSVLLRSELEDLNEREK
jgi:hypothetical protein